MAKKGLNPFLNYFWISMIDFKDGYARFKMPVLLEYL